MAKTVAEFTTRETRDRYSHGSSKMSRILWILNVLLSRGYLTREIAKEEIGIEHRSFFRYIGTLRDAGFMIDAEPGGIYHLRAMQPTDRAIRICTGRAKLLAEADLAHGIAPRVGYGSPQFSHGGSVSKKILIGARHAIRRGLAFGNPKNRRAA